MSRLWGWYKNQKIDCTLGMSVGFLGGGHSKVVDGVKVTLSGVLSVV